LVKASENVLSSLNSTYISPISLAENLVIYHFSGSKNACNMFGRVTAGGSYWTIQNTGKDLATIPPAFPDGDIIVVYDNNQVIGRQYKVSWCGTIPSSTVTGITVLKTEVQRSTQRDIPIPNILPSPKPSNLTELREIFNIEMNSIHRQYRGHLIKGRMEVLETQAKLSKGKLLDPIAAEDFKRYQPEKETLRYDRVPPDESICQFFDQECLPINPNSEETVLQVIEHIHNMAALSDASRKW
jgi:hypothetical protein